MTDGIALVEEDRFGSMARQMGQWAEQVLKQSYHRYCPDESWTPALNLLEDVDHYCVIVDLAGIPPEEIDLHAEDDRLVLSGQRAAPVIANPGGKVRLHVMEIEHGRFCRALQMPSNVDVDRIEASYRGGLLWIRLPKKA